ncbi:hypothetical protein DUI87_24566 [Hirundo rustica rustica]|uniref:Prokineticin domain-containing protein n=1 Tax=Hirundo rustica rustica TaxID=333673 RepID=A0A3M0JFD1_HIRRU|nr:hypothetical protein DUI87_24566 [Hirundo rustica rustica]
MRSLRGAPRALPPLLVLLVLLALLPAAGHGAVITGACERDQQCGGGMCCAVSLWIRSLRMCTPMGNLGDECHPLSHRDRSKAGTTMAMAPRGHPEEPGDNWRGWLAVLVLGNFWFPSQQLDGDGLMPLAIPSGISRLGLRQGQREINWLKVIVVFEKIRENNACLYGERFKSAEQHFPVDVYQFWTTLYRNTQQM